MKLMICLLLASVLVLAESKYKPKCGPVCLIFCQCGNVLDSNGCPICKCKNCDQVCPQIKCAPDQLCPNGFKHINGCQTCECIPDPVCPTLACPSDKICPNGFKVVNGCKTCECERPPICLTCCGPPPCCNTCGLDPVCPTLTCPTDKICPNGFKVVNGCKTCECERPKPECGPLCKLGCPCGNVLDHRGCPICKCKPCGPICPQIECPSNPVCSNGIKYVNGCQTCECNPVPICPDSPVCANPSQQKCTVRGGCRFCTCETQQVCGLPSCAEPCPYGQTIEKDDNGCDVCVCNPEPTCPSTPACAEFIRCRWGIKSINGCLSPTCECNPPTCKPLTCQSRGCERGFAQDAEGFACPTCECARREGSVVCNTLPCLALLTCLDTRPLVTDDKGCPVCLCGPAPDCPQRRCRRRCRHGNIFSNGCRTCRCKPAPITCPTLRCRRVYCSNGFVSDRRGCPTCRCNREGRRQSYFRRLTHRRGY